MKQEDFEERVSYLQNKQFVTSRKESTIIVNFYSLITIIIISVAIIIYTNYVVPAQQHNNKSLENDKKIISN